MMPALILLCLFADALKKNRDVEYVARLARWPGTLNVDGNVFNEKTGVAVDSDWFKIFDYNVVIGTSIHLTTIHFHLSSPNQKQNNCLETKTPSGKL